MFHVSCAVSIHFCHQLPFHHSNKVALYNFCIVRNFGPEMYDLFFEIQYDLFFEVRQNKNQINERR